MNKLVKVEYYCALHENPDKFVSEGDKLIGLINPNIIAYIDDSPIKVTSSGISEVYRVRINLSNSDLRSIYVTKESLNKILSIFDEIIY